MTFYIRFFSQRENGTFQDFFSLPRHPPELVSLRGREVLQGPAGREITKKVHALREESQKIVPREIKRVGMGPTVCLRRVQQKVNWVRRGRSVSCRDAKAKRELCAKFFPFSRGGS